MPGSGMFHFFRCQPFFLLFLHNIICLVSMVLTLKVRNLELVRVVFIFKWFTRTSTFVASRLDSPTSPVFDVALLSIPIRLMC